MTNLQIGDYIYVDYHHKNGTIIGDRGGAVGRWLVKFDDGASYHVSSRDCTLIKPARVPYPRGRISVEQKLDLLLEHLGLTILDEPKIVKLEEKSE